jgi:hypothetical protein
MRTDDPGVDLAPLPAPVIETRSDAGARRLRGWIDPIGPALALLAGAVYWARGFDGYLSRDQALYAYAGQQVADGVPAYEGVVNRAGPLAHLVPGAGGLVSRVLNTDDLLTMRWLFLLLSAACIWLAYLAGREVFSSRVAGVATSVALFAVSGFNLYATNGPREKTTLVLLLLCAVIAVSRYRFGWAGAFVSLATLTWQPALFVGAPFAVAALWAVGRGERLRGLGRFVVGGLAPLVGLLLWYAVIGKIRLFLDCFVLIHVNHTDQEGVESRLSEVRDYLFEVYGDFFWVILLGAAAIVVAALLTLAVPSRRRDPRQRLVAAAGVGLVFGVLWCFKAFNGWPDIFFLLPMTILGIGFLAREVQRRVPAPVAVALVLVWVVVVTRGEYQYARDTQDDTLKTQRAEIAAVFDVLPPDATVVSVEAPQPLVLTGRTNPFPHQMFDLGLDAYVADTWPGGLTGFGRDLDQLAPTVIARGTTRPIWLMEVLSQDYWRVGTTPGFTWYVHRSVPAHVQAQMRDIVNGG